MKLSDTLGITQQEMVVSNLDMDICDDVRWLKEQPINHNDRDAVEAALHRMHGGEVHPLVAEGLINGQRYIDAVMSSLKKQVVVLPLDHSAWPEHIRRCFKDGPPVPPGSREQ